jgi:hypothetical protein
MSFEARHELAQDFGAEAVLVEGERLEDVVGGQVGGGGW